MAVMPYAVGDQKICSACRQNLPLASFDKNRSAKDGLSNQCHACMAEARRRSKEAHPEEHRARHAKNRYGLGLAEYAAMVADTGGKCPVCGEVPRPPFKGFDVDHDHQTGHIRGLLCRGCNLALGGARDNSTILRALADYIDNHRARPLEPPVLVAEARACACGCGEQVPPATGSRPRQYVSQSHARRHHRQLFGGERFQASPEHPCDCGCGRTVPASTGSLPRMYATSACAQRAWRARHGRK